MSNLIEQVSQLTETVRTLLKETREINAKVQTYANAFEKLEILIADFSKETTLLSLISQHANCCNEIKRMISNIDSGSKKRRDSFLIGPTVTPLDRKDIPTKDYDFYDKNKNKQIVKKE